MDTKMGIAALRAVNRHMENRALQTLMGIVTGVLADGQLHDAEIALLKTWISANPEVTGAWPGSAIAAMVRDVCADGVITPAERELLLANLTALAGADFSNTGSVTPEPTRLPVDDTRRLTFRGRVIVHTGTFLFGTRARCEKASANMGALLADNVTRDTDILVIGGRVTPSWVTESYGRKIMQAARLRDEGANVEIISEAHWLSHLGEAASGGAA